MTAIIKTRVTEILGSGLLALGLTLGSDLGLFKIMNDLGRPFTACDIAKEGRLKERYVLEWLRAMASAKIVDYDMDSGEFSISKEYGTYLSSEEVFALGFIRVFGEKQRLIEKCFKLDGPNESGICVADVGCGVGKMASLLAKRFPNSSIWALDIDKELLKVGHERAVKDGLENIHFEPTDLHNVQESLIQKFDYIFCYDVIHDLPHPRVALEQVYKMLKAGGIFSLIEPNIHSSFKDNVNNLGSMTNYLFSLYVCLPHSLSCPGSEGWGRGMGEELTREFLKQVGFGDFTVQLEGDMNHFICTK